MVHPWKVKGFNIQIVNTRDKIQDMNVKNESLIDAQVQVATIVKSEIPNFNYKALYFSRMYYLYFVFMFVFRL